MIQWREEIVIARNIEIVWDLFSDRNIKRIMPKVEKHELVEKTEREAGALHRQTYREGKRLETYMVETLQYEDRADRKRKQVRFVLGKAFEITFAFELVMIDDTHTRFTYEGQNQGVNFIGRAMLKLGSKESNNKVVQEFMRTVEQEALKSN